MRLNFTSPYKLLYTRSAEGAVARRFDLLAEWRRVAHDVSGHSLPCGHFIPEEAPDALVAEILDFFEATAPGMRGASRSEANAT